jgi:predicted dehydrogenase
MSVDPIRVGIIGAGKNTRDKHIPGLQAIEGVEVVSVCNRSRASSERVAKEFSIPKVYKHWNDLVVAEDSNAIVIGTWPYLHYPITIAALGAGKHVLCEARMAMDASQAKIMLEAALKKPHLITQVVPAPHTLYYDQTIKKMVADGFLGEILAIEVRILNGKFLDESSPMHWRQDADLCGLNVMSLGIWYEAVMRWVGEALMVKAMGKTFAKMRRDSESGNLKAVKIPDHLNVLADMACGAIASFSISSATGLMNEQTATLFGSAGTISLRDGNLLAGKRGDDRLEPIIIPEHLVGGWRVEEEFINAIRGLEPITHTTFADGFKYMQFTEAMARSCAENRGITLPLFDL